MGKNCPPFGTLVICCWEIYYHKLASNTHLSISHFSWRVLDTVFCLRVSQVMLKMSSGLESHLNLRVLFQALMVVDVGRTVIWANDLKPLAPSGCPQSLAMWSSPFKIQHSSMLPQGQQERRLSRLTVIAHR